MCSKNETKSYLLCKKTFDEKNFFFRRYKNINKVNLIYGYYEKFAPLTIQLILLVFAHKIKFKKNKLFLELEDLSKNSNYNFYIHDISLYPLLFLKIDPKKIIFSITDFQVNRLFKLITISKKITKQIYYFLGFLHCLIVETFLFKGKETSCIFSAR